MLLRSLILPTLKLNQAGSIPPSWTVTFYQWICIACWCGKYLLLFINSVRLCCLTQANLSPRKPGRFNGSEFTSSVFTDWAADHGILVDYIKPGCPYQNAYIERFNRSYRNEVLDCYLFNNLNEVRQLTDEWIEVYNHERPHDSLNDMTPAEFKQVA